MMVQKLNIRNTPIVEGPDILKSSFSKNYNKRFPVISNRIPFFVLCDTLRHWVALSVGFMVCSSEGCAKSMTVTNVVYINRYFDMRLL